MARSRRCPDRLAIVVALLAVAQLARAQEAPPADAATAMPAVADQSDARIRALETEVAKLRDDLRRSVDAQQKRTTEDALLRDRVDALERRPSEPLFRRGGLSVRVNGYIQLDSVLYRDDSQDEVDPSTGAPLNLTRFLIRRARLRTDVDYKIFGGTLEFDGNTTNGPIARVTDVEGRIYWPMSQPDAVPYIGVKGGLFKIPFGYEVPEADWYRLFLERSNMASAFFPGEFDLGLAAYGGWRFLRYTFAAMNGEPAGERAFPDRDPNAAKDFIGHLGVDAALGRRVALLAGFSGLYGTGFHKGTPSTKDVVTWRDSNGDGQIQISELVPVLGSAAAPSQDFNRYAVGLDAHITLSLVKLGDLTLYGEVTWANNLDRNIVIADPIAVGRDLREFGWYVAAIQQLTPYAAIGVRYDSYNPDADAAEQRGSTLAPIDRSLSTLSIVAAAQYMPYGRLSFEYDHNTNAFGRTTGGLPTTLGEHVFTMRMQVAF